MPQRDLAKAQALAEQIKQLSLQLADMGFSGEEIAGLSTAAPPVDSIAAAPKVAVAKGRIQPHRQRILDALNELGQPVLSRDLQVYVEARYGERIEATRFGSLRRSEMDSYDRGSLRRVWIAYGLTDRGEAVKRLLARSDWELERRVVGPLTGRALFFSLTARLCEIFRENHATISDERAFKILIADHARDLPGTTGFQKGDFPIDQWEARAKEALATVAERDATERRHIALRLTMLDAKAQVFGTDVPAEDHSIQPPIVKETFAS